MPVLFAGTTMPRIMGHPGEVVPTFNRNIHTSLGQYQDVASAVSVGSSAQPPQAFRQAGKVGTGMFAEIVVNRNQFPSIEDFEGECVGAGGHWLTREDEVKLALEGCDRMTHLIG